MYPQSIQRNLKIPKVQKSTSEYLKLPGTISKYLKEPESSQKYLKLSQSTSDSLSGATSQNILVWHKSVTDLLQ